MVHNFIAKEPTRTVSISGEFVAVQLSSVSSGEEKSWLQQIYRSQGVNSCDTLADYMGTRTFDQSLTDIVFPHCDECASCGGGCVEMWRGEQYN